MEARLVRVLFVLVLPALLGAGYRTDNFTVTAPTPEIAKQVGQAAEHYRKQLAIDWLGYELPRWSARCPIRVKVGQIGAGGATTFSFYPNAQGSAEVANWDMRIQGSLERILDSVLPHEVSHTIFACHFRRPLPRWADEGAATLAEHESERRRQVLTVRQVIGGRRRIPLQNLLGITEYPADMQDVLTLYAEGYSLAELLVQEGGRERYLKFLADAHRDGWENAVRAHYGYRGVDDLERRWHDWIIAGSPEISLPKGQELAAAGSDATQAKGAPIVRGQSPADDPFIAETILTSSPKADRSLANELVAPEPRERSTGKPKPLAAQHLKLADRKRETESRGELLSVEDDLHRAPAAEPSQAGTKRPKNPARRPEHSEPAARRQVTEWSEFPQDPRPSPFLLPGGNRSGSRP